MAGKTARPKTRRVPVASIKTHPGLQPRGLTLLNVREAAKQETQSERHIQAMALFLKGVAKSELEPLRIANVDGVLYVVDGHHRLKAYKRAGRKTLPAKVETMTLQQASRESKLANIIHTQLEMYAEQKRNALWHYLDAITQRGSASLPQGVSQRSLAGRFGVALSTVQSMLKRLPEVDHTTFPEDQKDPITGFPHWRFVKETVRNQMGRALAPDARTQYQADRYGRQLVRLWERFPPAAVRLAHRQMLETARADLGTFGELEATLRDLEAARGAVTEAAEAEEQGPRAEDGAAVY